MDGLAADTGAGAHSADERPRSGHETLARFEAAVVQDDLGAAPTAKTDPDRSEKVGRGLVGGRWDGANREHRDLFVVGQLAKRDLPAHLRDRVVWRESDRVDHDERQLGNLRRL